MTKTSTKRELLIVAIQDLYSGEAAWLSRLPELSGPAGPGLAEYMAVELRRARTQAVALQGIAHQLGADPDGARNIWLNAILDDAERDSATIVRGPVRDIAMVGALRKAKQSERVSYETAIALAHHLGLDAIAQSLIAIRDEEAEADAALAALLIRQVG